MDKSKNLSLSVGSIILVPTLTLLLLPVSLVSAKPVPMCAADGCARQKAILRQLERTRPSRKVTRKQIFNRIKASCDKMRSLDCPDIRNYKPLICFTDF